MLHVPDTDTLDIMNRFFPLSPIGSVVTEDREGNLYVYHNEHLLMFMSLDALFTLLEEHPMAEEPETALEL